MSEGFEYSRGSYMLDNNGHVSRVVGGEKIKKEGYKLLVTDRFENFGTEIRSLIGRKISMNSMELNLRKFLTDAIRRYADIQKLNPTLTSDEELDDASVTVYPDPDDVTKLVFKIEFVLKSGEIVDDIPTQTLPVGAIGVS